VTYASRRFSRKAAILSLLYVSASRGGWRQAAWRGVEAGWRHWAEEKDLALGPAAK